MFSPPSHPAPVLAEARSRGLEICGQPKPHMSRCQQCFLCGGSPVDCAGREL